VTSEADALSGPYRAEVPPLQRRPRLRKGAPKKTRRTPDEITREHERVVGRRMETRLEEAPMATTDQHVEAIRRVFADPAAVWTVDEVAGRFKISLSEAIRSLADLEAIDVVRRIGDEYVPGSAQIVASSPAELEATG
jgi:hypothetical protein